MKTFNIQTLLCHNQLGRRDAEDIRKKQQQQIFHFENEKKLISKKNFFFLYRKL